MAGRNKKVKGEIRMKYLMDSNVIIDYVNHKLPATEVAFIEKLPVVISVVTRVELIGRYNATKQQVQLMKAFLDNATIFDLNENIILETISIRQKCRIKLPDAIIAATAIINKHTLITHDINDYKGIKQLKIIDSWAANGFL